MRYLGSTLLLVVTTVLAACTSTTPHPYAGGCVAADHVIASQAGAEILACGGNAVDAAVATSFTLSVVRPYSCGIGGGGFMLVYFSDEGLDAQRRVGRTVPRTLAINYREVAPAAVGPDYYERLNDPEASTRGGKAVAIPGTVAGLLSALDRYGTLDRATVLAPAIRAAEQGFEVDEHYISSTRDLVKTFRERPDYRRRFAFVWERYLLGGNLRPGDRITVHEQARVFRAIAQRGAAGFYDGEVGDAIVAAVQRDGGEMNASDLRSFIVDETAPLRTNVFGRTILSMPPPSSGGVAMLEALAVYERIAPEPPLGGSQRTESLRPRETFGSGQSDRMERAMELELWRVSPECLHPLIEASKHAFADRAVYLADPAFVDVPIHELLARSTEFADRYDPARTLPAERYGTPGLRSVPRDDSGTSHFCVVDGTGSAVSCTETINLEFGSLIAVPEFGFLLNNEMDDFTTRRGEPNAFGLTQSELNLPAPGKRPLSSMTPTIVLDGREQVRIVAGASGGPRIISSTMQCVLGAMRNPEISSAVILAAPRVHHQWSPDVLYIEPVREFWPIRGSLDAGAEGLRGRMVDGLRERGHSIRERTEIGNVQMIRRTLDGTWDPACDPRKGGKPAGVPR